MAKNHCGGSKSGGGKKTVTVRPHKRTTRSDHCVGPGKPGPKNVKVKGHKRSAP